MSTDSNNDKAPAYVPPHKRQQPPAALADAKAADPLAQLFNAIKAAEADMVEKDAKRVAAAAAAGNPVKELSFNELMDLRRKYNPKDDDWCPATNDGKHIWSPLRHCGNSWHGAIYGKDCTSCGHSWSSH